MSRNTTILTIDDEPINLLLFETKLKAKYPIISAKSGIEGLEKLRLHNEISIVFTDLKMPNMNGIEFVILAKKEFPNIPFILLTGYDINEEIMHAINKKILFTYLRKPFDFDKINDIIHSTLIDLQ